MEDVLFVEPHVWVSEYKTCTACNFANHRCHFCGEDLDHESYDPKGRRHWLSDCRPDLVAHEPGPLCTWRDDPEPNQYRDPACYAYQDRVANEWGTEHIHFYEDGPMA